MRWTTRDRTQWQRWFAWHPVYCEDEHSWFWWEHVWRRRIDVGNEMDIDYQWRYQLHKESQ